MKTFAAFTKVNTGFGFRAVVRAAGRAVRVRLVRASRSEETNLL